MSEPAKKPEGCVLPNLMDQMAMLAVLAISFRSHPTKETAVRLYMHAERAYENDLLGDAGFEAVTSHTKHFGVPEAK